MYCVKVKDTKYNELSYYFPSLDKAEVIITASLREGYSVNITLTVPENDPEIE